jgi:O-antigen chain-terminating methyltransferase
MVQSISVLVDALPEIYQPIFGHPELSGAVSRSCDDRLAHITALYHALAQRLGRPLRVLDLGCAQGFFSFSLARLGATVRGVDFLAANIAVCEDLAAEHRALAVTFAVARIEDTIGGILPDQYDLVLGLSVFHHIVHAIGAARVQSMLAGLAPKITAGLFELARADEPLYWARAQPANPRHLLHGFAFVHEVAQTSTHLSDVGRPLYVASNRLWYLNGQTGHFDTWQEESHPFARGTHQGSRRYFFGDGVVAKLFYLDPPARRGGPIARARHREPPARRDLNAREFDAETHFLLHPPPLYPAPRLTLHGRSEREAWLVRARLPGVLLSDAIRAGGPIDTGAIIRAILAQLAALERQGLYHNDIRTWNILLGPGGRASLIDYGAIGTDRHDCVWPHDVFLAFLVLVREIATRRVRNPVNLPLLSISPYRWFAARPRGLPDPYHQFLSAVHAHPRAHWSFALLARLFDEIDNSEEA